MYIFFFCTNLYVHRVFNTLYANVELILSNVNPSTFQCWFVTTPPISHLPMPIQAIEFKINILRKTGASALNLAKYYIFFDFFFYFFHNLYT